MDDGSGDRYGEFNSYKIYLISFHMKTAQGFQIADLCPTSCAGRFDGR